MFNYEKGSFICFNFISIPTPLITTHLIDLKILPYLGESQQRKEVIKNLKKKKKPEKIKAFQLILFNLTFSKKKKMFVFSEYIQ